MNAEEKLKLLAGMKDRGSIAKLLNDLGLTGVAAEIGVDMGYYAKGILSQWKGKHYLAVDLWAHQDSKVYWETVHFDHTVSFQRASDTAHADPRMILMKMSSTFAASLLADNILDWVWIDANHDAPYVLEDMNAWWPKLRSGGIFSGHDYPLPGVYHTVNKWMEEHRMKMVHVDSSWWSVKD